MSFQSAAAAAAGTGASVGQGREGRQGRKKKSTSLALTNGYDLLEYIRYWYQPLQDTLNQSYSSIEVDSIKQTDLSSIAELKERANQMENVFASTSRITNLTGIYNWMQRLRLQLEQLYCLKTQGHQGQKGQKGQKVVPKFMSCQEFLVKYYPVYLFYQQIPALGQVPKRHYNSPQRNRTQIRTPDIPPIFLESAIRILDFGNDKAKKVDATDSKDKKEISNVNSISVFDQSYLSQPIRPETLIQIVEYMNDTERYIISLVKVHSLFKD